MGKKIDITDEHLSVVKELFDNKIGARVISKKLGISRWTVQQIYKKLGIYNIGRKTPKIILNRTEYMCKICNITKNISNFRKREKRDRVSYECYCIDCEYNKNLNRLKARAKTLRKTNSNFIIRKSISYSIWKYLKLSNSSKNGISCLKYLPYSINELKEHLEKQFEPWMNWSNCGKYIKSLWDDKDYNTWTWQLDHIMPQSDLPYTSMQDDNFKKCWALENLRPLSSKQNNLDGANRTRHKSITIS